MILSVPGGPTSTDVVAAVAARHRELIEALTAVDEAALVQPSRLPGWPPLTILCHLRYGAEANILMTADILADRRTAYYPDGRERQRAATLQPQCGESPADVVDSLARSCQALDQVWLGVPEDSWVTAQLHEPDNNVDLGPLALGQLALLRLTEVEVHGSDLDLDLTPWSTTFVDAALPMRLGWLRTKRSNQQIPDRSIRGSWNLVSTDGPPFSVSVTSLGVTVDDRRSPVADSTISGTKVQLLAMLLGRVSIEDLALSGDPTHALSFRRAFPPP